MLSSAPSVARARLGSLRYWIVSVPVSFLCISPARAPRPIGWFSSLTTIVSCESSSMNSTSRSLSTRMWAVWVRSVP